MALVNSIAIGTGRKKVGEIVLATLQGRTVARKYQPNVRNPKTAAQIKQRTKMANIVMIWSIVSNFMKGAFVNRSRYHSAYNAFVRANIQYMDDSLMSYPWTFAENNVELYIKGGALGNIKLDALPGGDFDVTYKNISSSLKVGDKLRVLVGHIATRELKVIDCEFDQTDIDTGNSTVSPCFTGSCFAIAYIVTADGKKSTNCEFIYS